MVVETIKNKHMTERLHEQPTKEPRDWTILPTSHLVPIERAKHPAVRDAMDREHGPGGWDILPSARSGFGVFAVRTSVLEAHEEARSKEKPHA